MSSTGNKFFDSSNIDADDMEDAMRRTHIAHPKSLSRKVTHKMTFGETSGEVFCAKFDMMDKFLAVGMADGMARIYNMQSGKLAFSL